MKKRLVVTALITKGHKYVFIRKNHDQLLYLPGGEVNPHEDIYQALEREILEECNISIKNITTVDFVIVTDKQADPPTQTIYLRFVAQYQRGKLQPRDTEEIEAILTLAASEITNFKHNPHTIKFLQQLKII